MSDEQKAEDERQEARRPREHAIMEKLGLSCCPNISRVAYVHMQACDVIASLIASVIEDCAREAERVIAREIPCRCIDAYKDREMIDPNCSHHDAMDVATDIRALASPPPTPVTGAACPTCGGYGTVSTGTREEHIAATSRVGARFGLVPCPTCRTPTPVVGTGPAPAGGFVDPFDIPCGVHEVARSVPCGFLDGDGSVCCYRVLAASPGGGYKPAPVQDTGAREHFLSLAFDWDRWPKLAAIFQHRPRVNVYWQELADFIASQASYYVETPTTTPGAACTCSVSLANSKGPHASWCAGHPTGRP